LLKALVISLVTCRKKKIVKLSKNNIIRKFN